MRNYNNFVKMPPPPDTSAREKDSIKKSLTYFNKNRLIKHT